MAKRVATDIARATSLAALYKALAGDFAAARPDAERETAYSE